MREMELAVSVGVVEPGEERVFAFGHAEQVEGYAVLAFAGLARDKRVGGVGAAFVGDVAAIAADEFGDAAGGIADVDAGGYDAQVDA